MDKTSLVRFNILTIIAGLSFQNGIAIMLDHWGTEVALNGSAFLLLLTNFYHGKIASTESDEHVAVLSGKPSFALIDYILNIIVITVFAFMSYYVNNSVYFLFANIALRVADLVLVVFMCNWLHVGCESQRVRNAQKFWIKFDVFCIAMFSAILGLLTLGLPAYLLSYVLMAITLLDLVLDYLLNRELYFGAAA